MNFLRKVTRTLEALVAVPFYWVEKRESERKLEERLRRLEYKDLTRKSESKHVTALKKQTQQMFRGEGQ